MTQRLGHFMQAGLLDSQLQALEKPSLDETDVISLDIAQSVEAILQQALKNLKTSSTQTHTFSSLSI